VTAADQRLQISAYSLILDRRAGHNRLPDGWQVVAAGHACFNGAVSHDMGTALAGRMFHFHVQTAIDAIGGLGPNDGCAGCCCSRQQIGRRGASVWLTQEALVSSVPIGCEAICVQLLIRSAHAGPGPCRSCSRAAH